MSGPWAEVGHFALRVMAVGALVYVMSRFLPRRSGGALAAYDFVFFWMMGGLAVAPLYDLKIRLVDTAAAVAAVYLCHYALAGLALRSQSWARWLSGEPVAVISSGNLQEHALERARLPLEILLSELRVAGAARVSEVETAFLEPTGHLSVVKKPDHLPVTAGDLHLGSPDPPLPQVLVADGKVMANALARLGVSRDWLNRKLALAGAPAPAQLYAAIWEGAEPIYWAPRSEVLPPWQPPVDR